MNVLASKLVTWFSANARPLPWREEPRDPYRALVSELMAQQTQIDRVVPRFLDFVDRFPSLEALAAASEDEVLAAWSGLGYYRRARLLHSLALQVSEQGGGLPQRAEELEKLPGVGPYTAAAVASMVHGEAVPVLDGNVARVAARHTGFAGDPRRASGRRTLEAWVRAHLEGHPPGAVNEALMELGARVCTPRGPRCGLCPISEGCAWRSSGGEQPVPPPRRGRAAEELHWVAACAVATDGRWLLRQVEEGPILVGLWLPPFAELSDGAGETEAAAALLPGSPIPATGIRPAVRHSITHRRIVVTPVVFRWPSGHSLDRGWRLADPAALDLPTSSLLAKLVAAVN